MTKTGHENAPEGIHPSMKFVCERFHYVREQAISAFARDADFRDLCEEYATCARTVERLQEHGPAALCREYGALLLRLEREMLRYLEEHSDCQDS